MDHPPTAAAAAAAAAVPILADLTLSSGQAYAEA